MTPGVTPGAAGVRFWADALDALPAAPLRAFGYRIDAAVRDMLSADPPRLRLDRLSVAPLPPAAFANLRRRLAEGLTPEGWDLSAVEAVSRLAAGRAALGMDPGEAAAAIAADYLTCAATWSGARTDANPEEAALLRRSALDARIAEASAALDLTRTRTERVAELRRLATALAAEAEDGPADPTVKALRLSARPVKVAATRADLDAEWEAATGDRQDAEETLRAWAEEDAAEERRTEEAERARTAAEQARRQQAAQAAAQRQAAQEHARRPRPSGPPWPRCWRTPAPGPRPSGGLCGAPIRGAASWSWVSCGGRPIRPVPASGRPCWRRRRRPTWTGWARRRGPARAPTSQEAHAAAKEAVAALRAGRLPGPGLLAAAGIARAPLAAAPAAPVLPQAAGAPYPPKPRVGGVGRGPRGV